MSGNAESLVQPRGRGNHTALDALLPRVYDELRRLAVDCMRREAPGHTLRPTALVHEVYLRLVDQRDVDWHDRVRFFGLAAAMMRRVLINHARDRHAFKRGGGAQRVSLRAIDADVGGPDIDMVALDAALVRLARIDERKARVVELKFFGGMSNDEVAALLAVSVATVERDWTFARAWLFDALAGTPAA